MQHKKILTKVQRVIKEIYLLKEKECSAREFVEMFSLNKRTIQRDLKDIKSLGFDVEFCKKGTYRIYKEISEIAKNDEIMKYTEKKYNKKQICKVKENENMFFNFNTKDIAQIKQDNEGKYFYFIKTALNKIKFISDKFETRSEAVKDLNLAL